MKTKRVNRYYCDFCKKAGCSAGHMRKHEQRCTMNPNRTCGVCGLLEEEQQPMEALRTALPNPDLFMNSDTDGCWNWTEEWDVTIDTALEILRERANNCPACIMAALRQHGIPVRAVSAFNFTKEMQAIWDEVNRRNQEHVYYG